MPSPCREVYAAPGRAPRVPGVDGDYVDGAVLFICPNTPGVWQMWFLMAPWPYWFLMIGVNAWRLEPRVPLPQWVFQKPHQQIYVSQNYEASTPTGTLRGCDLHLHAHPMDQDGRYHVWRSNAVQQSAFWNTDASNMFYVGYHDYMNKANL